MFACLATVFLVHLGYYDVIGEPTNVQDLTNHKGHNKPFGESGTKVTIDSIEGFPDFVPFYENYILESRPLLMKGAAKIFPAFSKWTDDYIKKLALAWKDEDIKVACETKKTENDTLLQIKMMRLEGFLDIYNKTDLYIVDTVPEMLEAETVVPCPIQCSDITTSFFDTILWFSSGGSKSLIHIDSYDNINCLYRGNKTFTMLGLYRRSKLTANNITNYSEVDVDKIDLRRIPDLADATFYVANMVAGDCVYVPYNWVHQVRSQGSNLAINFWWDHFLSRTMVDFGSCYTHSTCDLDLTLAKVLAKKTFRRARAGNA